MHRILACVAVGISLAVPARPAAADAPQPDLNGIAQKAFDRGVTPGMTVAVIRGGTLVFERGYGFADVAKKTPATPQTPFAVGSMSKQFTAVSTLMLAQAGKLSLDDLLVKYIPNLPHAKTITLQNLLWQTSGLHNYPLTTEHDWPLEGSIEPKKLFAIMATDKPDFEPGSKWEYSNANYAALAGVVADASRMPYGTFLQSRIFGPLGMTASGYGYRAQQTLPLATAYQGKNFATYPQTLSLDLTYGAGGVVSSAHDVSLWLRALMAGTLLDAEHTKLLWSAGHLSDGTPTQYAMGFVPTALDGHTMVWHNGFTPTDGGYCYDAIFPDDGIGVVVLTNADVQTAQGMPEALTRAIFEALVPTAAAAAAPNEDPAVTAKVKSYFAQLASGDVDRTALDPKFAAMLTPELLGGVKTMLAQLGPPQRWTFLGTAGGNNGSTRYDYRIDFASGPHTFQVWFGTNGLIAGSYMPPG